MYGCKYGCQAPDIGEMLSMDVDHGCLATDIGERWLEWLKVKRRLELDVEE